MEQTLAANNINVRLSHSLEGQESQLGRKSAIRDSHSYRASRIHVVEPGRSSFTRNSNYNDHVNEGNRRSQEPRERRSSIRIE